MTQHLPSKPVITRPLRVAINFGNPVLAQRAPDGTPQGVSVALAHALVAELGCDMQMVFFDAAGKVSAAATEDVWDVAFMAIDPERAKDVDFTDPYVVIEGSYLVWNDAPFQTLDDVDASGVKVSVGKGAAYDLYLTRALKHAELVRVGTSNEAVEVFLQGGVADVAAGVRQPLSKVAAARGDVRVIPGSFTSIRQAMATARHGIEWGDYLIDFVERQKANGLVAAQLAATGQTSAAVAPPRVR